MEVGFGTKLRDGSLPVFRVGSREEAKRLLTMACSYSNGKYYSRELAVAQTQENLELFSAKLDQYHDLLIQHGQCDCDTNRKKDA